MQDVIQKIQSICEEFPFQEKYLVIPSYRMKGQIQKYLNDHGLQSVNLNIVSAGSIAMEWAEPDILKNGSKVLSGNDVADLIGEVLAKLKGQGKLQFLRDTLITPGLNRVISNGILELKKNGIRSGVVNLSALQSTGKRNDLEQIYATYEGLLKEKNYLDHADLIEIAIKNIDETGVKSAACYIMPRTKLSYLEQELLSRLNPHEQMSEDKDNTAYELNLAGKPWRTHKAYGEYNEVKAVIREIVLGKIPLDSVLVAVTTAEPYTQLFYQLLQAYLPGPGVANARTELPITFGTGLPIIFTNPGKLVLALLKWVKYGYRSHDLISIFSSGSFKEETQTISRETIIRVIKDSNLKWQRKTYHKTFGIHREYLERKIIEYATNPTLQKIYQQRMEALDWLDQVLEEEILPNLPEADELGRVNADQLYRGISRIIQKYKHILGDLDKHGYDAVLAELSGSLKTEPVLISEAVDIVVDRIKQVRTMISDPVPGKLHVTTYYTAGWIDREHTYLLGLDVGKFPGMAVENPFLLDEERVAVADHWLVTSLEKIEDKIKSMNRFLDSVPGQLTLSYSCFNNVDQRAQYPSSLYVDARDAIGEERVTGFLTTNPQECIDESDEWIRLAMTKGAMGEAATLKQLFALHPEFAHLKSKISKEACVPGRVVVSNPATVDPRISGRVQSASALADYLNCNYKYLLKHIMNLKEFKEKEFDTIGWLDPLESGSLFHEVLEEFHNRAMKDPKIRSDETLAIETIQKIANDTIKQYEEDLPTASAFYTATKKEDILMDCQIYAQEEVQHHNRYEPIRTEFRFGFEGDLVLPLGEGEQIRIMGAIDRIDRLPDGQGLLIVDYKTGGNSSYRILDDLEAPFLNQKSLQPALYYMALKELSKKEPLGEVKEAVYHFVNRKGDYEERTIYFSRESEKQYQIGLSNMFQQMVEGEFEQSEVTEKLDGKKSASEIFAASYLCRYCGYKEICAQALPNNQTEEEQEEEVME